MRGIVLAALLAGWAGLATPLAAEPDIGGVDLDAERAAIARFQDADQRLQDVGWTIIRGNAEFCPRVIPSIGLQLQDLASYGSPKIARAALGFEGDFAVETAARGSPAALSGEFARNREIVALERFDPNEWPSGSRKDWRRLKRAHDHVDAMLAEHGGITVRFADGGEARVTPVDVCATRFELMGGGRRAVADGERVVIGIEFPAFSYEEAVFAGVVAHELAHNFLAHSEWLDRNKRKRRHVRRTEREADRLMPWLLANAGYDPEAAIRFMETWGRKHDGGLFRARTHDGWDERAEVIAAEIPLIRELMAREGKADWSAHFKRGIDPDKER
ncbi:hypothetical protein Ga0102493_11865 [Erythrobacter litoralis]|uniref:Peptidase M48 domain-containing protein n=1 Tax=Erythrobacter litoralis TaxID=39960 RepID=A0A074MUN9_9SPHN|nr:hypothetical protein [Erythrobacter litoralis]AOL24992.1 hypothetical protein Ga0102493_11865 [Erythrobacter litoralis]KEO96515.1 hypothetical protein EH32_09815 [Erythrobacter litoralis]